MDVAQFWAPTRRRPTSRQAGAPAGSHLLNRAGRWRFGGPGQGSSAEHQRPGWYGWWSGERCWRPRIGRGSPLPRPFQLGGEPRSGNLASPAPGLEYRLQVHTHPTLPDPLSVLGARWWAAASTKAGPRSLGLGGGGWGKGGPIPYWGGGSIVGGGGTGRASFFFNPPGWLPIAASWMPHPFWMQLRACSGGFARRPAGSPGVEGRGPRRPLPAAPCALSQRLSWAPSALKS